MYQLQQSLPQDLKAIAGCHLQCFPHSFTSKLGIAYATKTFEWFLAGDNRFLFHITDEDEVLGYCGGFISRFEGDGSTSGMLQFAMKQAIAGVLRKPWLLFHRELWPFYPLIFRNIARKISGRNNKNPAAQSPASLPEPFHQRAGLVVIGVHPLHRGKGVFELLMKEFDRQANVKGASSLYLSVKKNNERAIRAYTKAGWSVMNEHPGSLELGKILTIKAV